MLFLTMHEDESLLHEALRAGAAGYVIKRAEESEILAGDPRGEPGRHLRAPRDDPRAPPAARHDGAPARRRRSIALTRRELDVLRLLAKGNTNRQIADLLELSMRTVENHRANLMGKLGLVSRVELVNYAEEHDLL